jgi:hypothetical protein
MSNSKLKKFSTIKLKEAFDINEILWIHEDNKIIKMTEFHNSLLKLKKNQFAIIEDNNIDEVLKYEIIGVMQINKKLKKLTVGYLNTDFYLYIITDYKKMYVSISITPFDFWYEFTSMKDLKNFLLESLNVYNPDEYNLNHKNNTRGFIGTESMLGINILGIERNLILNKFTEILTWGSFWEDYPFREYIIENDLSIIDRNTLGIQAMKQVENKYEISIRTLFSKSIINIENYDGAFIVNIYYNPVTSNNAINNINKKYDRNYPDNIPMDVILSIVNFFYQNHISLLDMNDISISNFIIAQLIANDQSRQNDLILKLEEMKTKLEPSKYDEFKEIIDEIIKETTINKYLNILSNSDNFSQLVDEINEENSIDAKNKIKQGINDELSEGKITDLIKKNVYDDTVNIIYRQKKKF